MADPLDELLQFLTPSGRVDQKSLAMQYVLGLTGKEDSRKALTQKDGLLDKLVMLLADEHASVAKDAALALINLSGDKPVAKALLDRSDLDVVAKLWAQIEDRKSAVADPACMILSNLTMNRENCDRVLEAFGRHSVNLDKVVNVFCQEDKDPNSKLPKLHYLGPVLSNLSQLEGARRQLLDKSGCVLQRLLPFTEYSRSRVRRGGIVGTLRNCCFNPDYHEWLLSDDIDLLPRLLLPLAGPTPDELDPDDVEKLPLDLQYLDEDKKREDDPDLRRMLLEAITQLCSTRRGREIIREKSTYFILRELHKVERDRQVRLACENLVDIVIKKEEEINLDNYHDVVVPEDVVPELEQMDKDYLATEDDAKDKK